MSWNFQQMLKEFAQKENSKLLYDTKHGMERECLRINPDGSLSMEPHPKNLGSALTNPYISTDFSESQLELVTPAVAKEESARKFLEEIHSFIFKKNKDLLAWPASMPCRLPHENEIPLADYGDSEVAKKKRIYRRALGFRYRRKMQTIAGIHYNFSFGEKFWQLLYKKFAKKDQSLQDFISEGYLKMARNYLELVWMDVYLFGASPAMDRSYMEKRKRPFKKHGASTYYGKYATSIRMSHFGYSCESQTNLQISYNDIYEYVNGLRAATQKPYKKYSKIGMHRDGEQIQLNYNLLQIPNEYYASIRPKRIVPLDGNILDALEKEGIQYLEIRSVDINPYEPVGVSKEHLLFLHTFMVYCLMKEAENISGCTYAQILKNTDRVALYGRKPELKILKDCKKVKMKKWALEVLDGMLEVAKIIDKGFADKRHTETIEKQIQKFLDPTLTPSAKVLTELQTRNLDFLDFGIEQSKKHATHLKNQELTDFRQQQFEKSVEKSLQAQGELEVSEEMFVKGYEDLQLSTQILIREAQKRGIDIEVVNRETNILRLSKGAKIEYVREATMTSLDSMITYFLMEDKQATKRVLAESNISVPKGGNFQNEQDALAAYEEFSKGKYVIKPNTTNFGIGINFTKAGDKKLFEKGVKDAFQHSTNVVIEEFIEGTEYRLIVIGDKVIGISHRVPANVIGDGIHTIAELVKMKNENPKSYKIPKYHMKIGKVEKEKLAEQNLTPDSILKKDQQVFMRENTNVSTGGDPLDYTDEVHQSYKDISVRAAQIIDAKICGVDMILKDPKKPATSSNHSIIELNFNPSLMIHRFPYKGTPRNGAPAVLDLLGF